MRSLLDGLPPEVAQQIHPDWRKNEIEYWAQRDKLLAQYADQFIAFADGRVLAARPNSVEIIDLVLASGQHPFVIRVGHGQEPMFLIRSGARMGLVFDASVRDHDPPAATSRIKER